jgi:hypothetical protein
MENRALLALALVLATLGVAAPAGHRLQPTLDEAVVATSLRDIATIVEREYFDPEVARVAADTIRSRLRDGAYAGLSLRALAAAVSRDLFEVTRDRHMGVAVISEAQQQPTSSEDQERQSRGRRENFGVQRVELLAGNVGHLDLRSFYRPEEGERRDWRGDEPVATCRRRDSRHAQQYRRVARHARSPRQLSF